ncbi:NADPH oxidoreductase A-like [Dreissena polymorpha]|uniref:Uncharacterized protein n=1 Tax=Dreissena polymorpha TaxID=45954 RepID=A0A9D4S409_DREPO|nr:NADPH oxidoreductase A-like [Dreissena polymorpha]KAH3889663.1 hypothetical protein DPMN_013724 [Dreissena polymorpha]
MFLYFGFAMVAVVVFYVYRVITTSSGSDFHDNSIDAFIVEDTGLDKNISKSRTNRYQQDYLTEGRQVLILYGTEYGCSEEIAKLLYDRLKRLNSDNEDIPLQPRVINVRDYALIDFQREHVTFVVISTSGDGVPPSDAVDFCSYVKDTDIPGMSRCKFSVLALGDSNYPQFCKVGRFIHERFIEMGGECVVPQTDVDMEDWTVINKWLDSVVHCLTTMYIPSQLDYIQHGSITVEDHYSRKTPFLATLKVKLPLTKMSTGDDKETIHCEFDITGSGLAWQPGDALGIYPENNPSEVEALLDAMKCSGEEVVPVPSWVYQTGIKSPDVQPLSVILRRFFDLKSVKVDLLEALLGHNKNEVELKKLDLLLQDGVSKSNTQLHQYLEHREVADVLQDFSSHQLPWKQILANLKCLQPRYYSIASSSKTDSNMVSIAAAVIRYTTLGKPRTGVTTTFLQDRCIVGDTCPVFVSHNIGFHLPADTRWPLILIGPGTGLAPFMAFIQERAMEMSQMRPGQQFGEIRLYFGCQHREKDFLYRHQLESWDQAGIISLRTAFSRDQAHKVYVQHLIHEDAVHIWRMLDQENAHIYVCGDAKHMARDVHVTLTKVIKGQGHMSQKEAELYLQNLEQNCARYQKDVWVI